MADAYKPNDIFIATSDLQEPVTKATEGNQDAQLTNIYTFEMMSEGMTGDNTQLLSYDDYKNSDFAKEKYTDENGVFREDVFNKDYQLAVLNYAMLTDKEALSAFSDVLNKQTPYSYTSPYSVLHPDTKTSTPSIVIHDRMSIGMPSTIGWSGLNRKDTTPYSYEELAQMNPHYYDPSTGKWVNNSVENESLVSKIGTTFNYAKYEADEYTEDPVTGEKVYHKKGEWKLDENGMPYCEVLGNRSLANKQVVQIWDILTSEGSSANKIFALESDDLHKSGWGVAVKTVARTLPYFIPVVNEYLGIGMAIINLGFALPQLANTIKTGITGEEWEGVNAFTNFGLKFLFQASPSSQNGDLVNGEMIADMFADTVGQLWQQRAASTLPYLFKKPYAAARKLRKEQLWLEANKALRNKEEYFQHLKAYNDYQNKIRLSFASIDAPLGTGKISKHYTKQSLSAISNLGYMTLVTTQDVYKDALEHGFSEREAAAISLSTSLALYGIMRWNTSKFGYGKRFLSMTTNTPVFSDTGEYVNLNAFKTIALDEATKEQARLATKGLSIAADKQTAWKSISRLYNACEKAYLKHGIMLEDIWKDAIVESAEELTEEVTQDLVKGAFDAYSWLGSRNGSFGGLSNFTDPTLRKLLVLRYFTTAVGGAMGGGVFSALRHINRNLKNWMHNSLGWESVTPEAVDYDLWQAAQNGLLSEVEKALRDPMFIKAMNYNSPALVSRNINGENVGVSAEINGLPATSIAELAIANVLNRIQRVRRLFDSVYGAGTSDSEEKAGLVRKILRNLVDSYKTLEIEEKYFTELQDRQLKKVVDALNDLDNAGEDQDAKKAAETRYKETVKEYNDFWSQSNIDNLNQQALLFLNRKLRNAIGLLDVKSFVYNITLAESGLGIDYDTLTEISEEDFAKLPESVQRKYKNYWDHEFAIFSNNTNLEDIVEQVPMMQKVLSSILQNAAPSFNKGKRNFMASLYHQTFLQFANGQRSSTDLVDTVATGLTRTLSPNEEGGASRLVPFLIDYLELIKQNPSAFTMLFLLDVDYLQEYIKAGILSLEQFLDLFKFNPATELLVHDMFNTWVAYTGLASLSRELLIQIVNKINSWLADKNNNANNFIRHLKMIQLQKTEKGETGSTSSLELEKVHLEKALIDVELPYRIVINTLVDALVFDKVNLLRVQKLIADFVKDLQLGKISISNFDEAVIKILVARVKEYFDQFNDPNKILELFFNGEEVLNLTLFDELQLANIGKLLQEASQSLLIGIQETDLAKGLLNQKVNIIRGLVRLNLGNSADLANQNIYAHNAILATAFAKINKDLEAILDDVVDNATRDAQVDENAPTSVDLLFYDFITATDYIKNINGRVLDVLKRFIDTIVAVPEEDSEDYADKRAAADLLFDYIKESFVLNNEIQWDQINNLFTQEFAFTLLEIAEEIFDDDETLSQIETNFEANKELYADEIKKILAFDSGKETVTELVPGESSTYNRIMTYVEKVSRTAEDPVENLLKSIYHGLTNSTLGDSVIEYINRTILAIKDPHAEIFTLGRVKGEYVIEGEKGVGILQDILHACVLAESALNAMRRADFNIQETDALNIISSYADLSRSLIQLQLAEGKISKTEAETLLSQTAVITTSEYMEYAELLDAIKSQLQTILAVHTLATSELNFLDLKNTANHVSDLRQTYTEYIKNELTAIGKVLKNCFSVDDRGNIENIPDWVNDGDTETENNYRFTLWVEAVINEAINLDEELKKEYEEALRKTFCDDNKSRIYLSSKPADGTAEFIDSAIPKFREISELEHSLNLSFIHYRMLSLLNLSSADFVKKYALILQSDGVEIVKQIDQEIAVRELLGIKYNLKEYKEHLDTEYTNYLASIKSENGAAKLNSDFQVKTKLGNTAILRGSAGSGKSSVCAFAFVKDSIANGRRVYLSGSSDDIIKGIKRNIFDKLTEEEKQKAEVTDVATIFNKLTGNNQLYDLLLEANAWLATVCSDILQEATNPEAPLIQVEKGETKAEDVKGLDKDTRVVLDSSNGVAYYVRDFSSQVGENLITFLVYFNPNRQLFEIRNIDGVSVSTDNAGDVVIDEATYLDRLTIQALDYLMSKSDNVQLLAGDRRQQGHSVLYKNKTGNRVIDLREDFDEWFTVPGVELDNSFRSNNKFKLTNTNKLRRRIETFFPDGIVSAVDSKSGEAITHIAEYFANLQNKLKWGKITQGNKRSLVGDAVIRNEQQFNSLLKILAEESNDGASLAVIVNGVETDTKGIWVADLKQVEEVKEKLRLAGINEELFTREDGGIKFLCPLNVQGREFDNTIIYNIHRATTSNENIDVDYVTMYTLMTRSKKFSLVYSIPSDNLDIFSLKAAGSVLDYLSVQSEEEKNPPIPGDPNSDRLTTEANAYKEHMQTLAEYLGGVKVQETETNPEEEPETKNKEQEISDEELLKAVNEEISNINDVELALTEPEDDVPLLKEADKDGNIKLLLKDVTGKEVQVPLLHAFYLRLGIVVPGDQTSKLKLSYWKNKYLLKSDSDDFTAWLHAAYKEDQNNIQKSFKDLTLEFFAFRNSLYIGKNVVPGQCAIKVKSFDPSTDSAQLLIVNDPTKEKEGACLMLYLAKCLVNGTAIYVSIGRLGSNANGDVNSEKRSDAQQQLFDLYREKGAFTNFYTFDPDKLSDLEKEKSDTVSTIKRLWQGVSNKYKSGAIPISGLRTYRGFDTAEHLFGRYTVAELKKAGFKVEVVKLPENEDKLLKRLNRVRNVPLQNAKYLTGKPIVKITVNGLEGENLEFYTRLVSFNEKFTDSLESTKKTLMLSLYSVGSILRALLFVYFGENRLDIKLVEAGFLHKNPYQLMGDSLITEDDRKTWFNIYNLVLEELLLAIELDKFSDKFKTGDRSAVQLFDKIGNINAKKLRSDLVNLVKYCSDAFLTSNGAIGIDSDFNITQNSTARFGIEWGKLKAKGVTVSLIKNSQNMSKFFNTVLKDFAYREINKSELTGTLDNFYVEYIPQMPRFIIPLATTAIPGGLQEVKVPETKIVIETPNVEDSVFPHYSEKDVEKTMKDKFLFAKPLVVFDLETTGTSIETDRIVQIAARKYYKDLAGNIVHEDFITYVNPHYEISQGASNIHHITSDMVQDAPSFADIADDFLNFISGCDLAGYNSINFDLPLLQAEFERNGIDFELTPDTIHLDVSRLITNENSRAFLHHIQNIKRWKLVIVYKGFYGKDFENAHDAAADVLATFDVMSAVVTHAISIGTLLEASTEILQPFATGEVMQGKKPVQQQTSSVTPEKYLDRIKSKDKPESLLDLIKLVSSFTELMDIINNPKNSLFSFIPNTLVLQLIVRAIAANLVNEGKKQELETMKKEQRNKLLSIIRPDKDLENALNC